MNKKKDICILIGIGLINLINGTLLNLSPVIFKSLNLASTWFIGSYLTINTFIIYLGCSNLLINRFSLKINYNLVTYLNVFMPTLLLYLTIVFKSKLLLLIYVISFAILQILRSISLNGITMLDRNNINLVKNKNIISTITAIIGLFLGQFILDFGINYFFIYLFINIIIGTILLFIYRCNITQKKFINKNVESTDLKSIGLLLGVGRGCSLTIIAMINYLIVLNTHEYGYLKVIESIFAIIFLTICTNYIKHNKNNIDRIINVRTIILFIPLLILLFMSQHLNLLIMVIASISISLTTTGEDVLLNAIFAKMDHKNINKHSLLFSYYYKICTLFLFISILTFKVFDCKNIQFLLGYIIIITVIMIVNNLLMRMHVKKVN